MNKVCPLFSLTNFDTRKLPFQELECLVVGSGIAGLYTACLLARAGRKVAVITKRMVENSASEKAQGGIAVAIGMNDSPLLHYQDTVLAGAGLCEPEAALILAEEGPQRLQNLLEMGAQFVKTTQGFALTREGAHRCERVLYAGGDATGAEIQRVLYHQAEELKIPIIENYFLVDLLVSGSKCWGALVLQEQTAQLSIIYSPTTIIASGGAGHLFATNTNPPVCTGDGMAIAYRAGAAIADMEFVQFHPTVLSLPGNHSFLITEAMRGEGAVLRNDRGQAFMKQYHPETDLAPRDVVVRAILAEMAENKTDHVYLDVTALPLKSLQERFPNIARTCAEHGINITLDWIPVAPAAHYFMGGIKTDTYGQTDIEGLYACGEVALAGVHGANRLASNSLLDGLVFGGRIADRIQQGVLSEKGRPHFYCLNKKTAGVFDQKKLRTILQQTMDRFLGPIRTPQGLQKALGFFLEQEHVLRFAAHTREEMEFYNMLQVGALVAEAASARQESRGAHYRSDYPDSRESWQKHLIFQRVHTV